MTASMATSAVPCLIIEQLSGVATIQDGGRAGLGHLAVPPSGALDHQGLADLNRLLGNPPDAAAIEVCGSLAVVLTQGTAVAVTGAPAAVRVNDRAAAWGRVLYLAAGDHLRLATRGIGWCAYLGVLGGWRVDPVMGSRSTDLLSCLGPAALEPGDGLPAARTAAVPLLGEAAPRWQDPSRSGAVRLHPGPRRDWFTPGAWRSLMSAGYLITGHSNRTALRLRGRQLARAVAGELPSEPLLSGAVQVPPDGQPIVFLRDHPTTGGYPVIAVVDPQDLDRCVQRGIGGTLRFTAGSK